MISNEFKLEDWTDIIAGTSMENYSISNVKRVSNTTVKATYNSLDDGKMHTKIFQLNTSAKTNEVMKYSEWHDMNYDMSLDKSSQLDRIELKQANIALKQQAEHKEAASFRNCAFIFGLTMYVLIITLAVAVSQQV